MIRTRLCPSQRTIGCFSMKVCCTFLVLFVATVVMSTVHGAEKPAISVERVFGPEIKTGDYKHPACITELQNGDLYLAYYGGAGEYAESTVVYGSRKAKGQDAWTLPVVIASNPVHSLGNPVAWQAPDGIVWLFFVTRFGETWSTSRIAGKISRDNAQTWSETFMVTMDEGTMVRGQPIALNNGDYLLPIYRETGHDTEVTGPDSVSQFLRKTPGSWVWKPSGEIRSPRGNLQPAVVQLTDQKLLAFCRRAGDYLPTTRGWIVRGESNDGGFTWSEGVDTEFPNPNAAVELIRLRNGHLLLIYNDSFADRTPLRAAISTDGGATFPHRRNLVDGPNDYGYPMAIQSQDEKIHVVFTSDERKVVNVATFAEDALLAQ